MPVKKDVFAKAVLRKGFCEIRNGDHIYYRFVQPDGNESPHIKTKISHGSGKDISDVLLVKMSRQMMFDNKSDLMKFIECTLSSEDYCEILQDKGMIYMLTHVQNCHVAATRQLETTFKNKHRCC